MRTFTDFFRCCFVVLLGLFCSSLVAVDYSLGPDSKSQEDVPKGALHHDIWHSDIFPGTVRDYWVYVPAQYDPSESACLMVFNDGRTYVNNKGSFRTPIVFDNLIHRREMPVTIGVFINPGEVPSSKPGQAARKNRSFEYDSLGDQYVRFLMEELLPQIQSDYHITADPAGRAICGISSGGIAAFTAAWERPDAFGKVVSHIGSFVNIRGGHVYPFLIRKTDKKPLKIFLQEGSNDLDNLHGHWPLANQEMAAALQFKGYEYQFIMGEGSHSGQHGGAILPDTLRWLWDGYSIP
jgi:enterochelin esterase-like enzyme